METNNKVNPLMFGNKGAISPLIFNTDKTDEIVVITADAEGGKYVKAGMLYYKYEGIEIWADLESKIIVNKLEKSFTVRRNDIHGKKINPEDQKYVILLYPDDDDEERMNWIAVDGRETAYDWIKTMIGNGYDPDKSIIISETVDLSKALTITEYVKYLKNANLVPDDDFDIEDYRLNIDYEDEEEEEDGGEQYQ